MAISPLKNVRAEKRDSRHWSQMPWLSFQKIDLHFVHWNSDPNRPIFRDIRGRNILPVNNAIKWGSTVNHHNHKNGSTIGVFLNYLCKHKSSDEIELASIVVEFCFFLVVFFPKIITLRLFRTHILRNSVGWHLEDLLN